MTHLKINVLDMDSHESFVAGADLLDVKVELGIDVRLHGAVRPRHADQTSYVLKNSADFSINKIITRE